MLRASRRKVASGLPDYQFGSVLGFINDYNWRTAAGRQPGSRSIAVAFSHPTARWCESIPPMARSQGVKFCGSEVDLLQSSSPPPERSENK